MDVLGCCLVIQTVEKGPEKTYRMPVWRIFFFFFFLQSDKWPFNEKRDVIVLEVAIAVVTSENLGSNPYFHWHFFYHVTKIGVFGVFMFPFKTIA